VIVIIRKMLCRVGIHVLTDFKSPLHEKLSARYFKTSKRCINCDYCKIVWEKY